MIIRSGPGPVFLAALKDATVESGTPLELTVGINAPAEPVEVVWQKDNKPVETKTKTSFSDGKCTLKIDSCSLADAGEYAVIVKNSAGTVTSSSKITIKGFFNHSVLIFYPAPVCFSHIPNE